MCGICGVYSPTGTGPPIDRDALLSMAAAMHHRGPDDEGWYTNGDHTVGFGFRRLSIVDLAGGHQPMSNEDGSIWIVFNGEIYNHEDWRPKLEERGHRYATRCDTETIIHLYEEYGLECVQHMRGMFAFAIWDDRRRCMILARDRLGIKPLYYARLGGQFVFASEIKSILQHPDARRTVDPDALVQYLTYGLTPAPRTMFANIQKLPPGHLLVLDESGKETPSVYWDAIPVRSPITHAEDAVAELRRLLADSVRLRMMSDVPMGALLSGGLDSSLVTTLMARQMDRPVDAFSVDYDYQDRRGSELAFAQQAAEASNSSHHVLTVQGPDLLRTWAEIVHYQDEPVNDPACYPMLLAARAVRQAGVVVVQVGEGGDELFAGYDRYTDILALDHAPWSTIWPLPGVIRRALASGIHPFAQASGRGLRKAYYLDGAATREQPFWGAGVALVLLSDRDARNNLFTPGLRRTLTSPDPLSIACAYRDRLLATRPGADRLEQVTYLEIKLRLAEMLLMRVDKMSMAASVEARVPLLDHKLVEFALSLPANLRVGSTTSPHQKWLLKRAAEGVVPAAIISRPKQGFVDPAATWIDHLLRAGMREEVLASPLIRESGWFNIPAISTMLRLTHPARDLTLARWALVNLILWHREWIER